MKIAPGRVTLTRHDALALLAPLACVTLFLLRQMDPPPALRALATPPPCSVPASSPSGANPHEDPQHPVGAAERGLSVAALEA